MPIGKLIGFADSEAGKAYFGAGKPPVSQPTRGKSKRRGRNTVIARLRHCGGNPRPKGQGF